MEKNAKSKKNFAKTFAVIRCAVALVLALVLLLVSGCAVGDLLSSATEVTDAAALEAGDYVQLDISYVMDIIGTETGAGGNVKAYYVIAPVGNQFVVIRVPASQFDDFSNLYTETINYLNGYSTSMSYHIIITGTTEENSLAVDRLLAQWYYANCDTMVSGGMIAEVDDGYTYLSTVTVKADQVGNVSYVAGMVLSILMAVLVVYAVVEAFLIVGGAYNRKKTPKAKAPKEKKAAPVAVEAPVIAEAPAEAEPSSEETEEQESNG